MAVKFTSDTSNLIGGIGQASSALGGFGIIAADIGSKLVSFGEQSEQMASSFQQSSLKIQAYAGMSQAQIDSMNASVLAMSGQVGVGPKELADALYPLISSGYSSSQALNMLSLSAKTAAASGASTAVVADALSTSLGAMHAPASQASLYMDMINKMVSIGKGEVPQYAAVIGKLALAAGSANVPFADMGAALADLTTHGFPSVAQASTSLGSLMTQVGPKVDTLAKHAQSLGLSFNETAFKSMSLSEKIAYLNQVTDGNQGEVLKLLGGSTLAQKAFNALSGSAQAYSHDLAEMNNAQGTTSQVFATASQGYEFQVQRQNAAFQALQVTIGSQMLPALTGMSMMETNLIVGLTDWIAKTQIISNALNGLGSLANTYATPALKSLEAEAATMFDRAIPKADAYAILLKNDLNWAVVSATPVLQNYSKTAIAEYGKVDAYIKGTLLPDIGKVAAANAPKVQQAAKQAGGEAVSIGDAGLGNLQKIAQSFHDYWYSKIVPAGNDAKPGFEHLGKSLDTLGTGLAAILLGGNGKSLPDLKQALLDALPNAIRLSGAIADNLGGAIDYITPDIEGMVQSLADFGDAINTHISPDTKNFFGQFHLDSNQMKLWWDMTWGAMGASFKLSWDLLAQTIHAIWDTIQTIIFVHLDIMQGKWNQVGDDLKNGMTGVFNDLLKPWQNMIDNVSNILPDTVKKSLGQMGQDVADWYNKYIAPILQAFTGTPGYSGPAPTIKPGGWTPSGGGGEGGNSPHFASGGYTPGGSVWVGEQGPELVDLPGGSYVHSAGSSGGAQVIELHNHIYLDSRELAGPIGRAQQQLVYLHTGVGG